MKAAFLECMKQLYPQGVTSREQLRDLIHCFSMGWAESFRHAVETEQPPVLRELRMAAVASAVEAWQRDAKEMGAVGWLPDASWQWWPAKIAAADEMAAAATQAAEHYITMIDGVTLKTPMFLGGRPFLGMVIPHLGKVTEVEHLYSHVVAGRSVTNWRVNTEQHSCQP